MCLNYVLYDFSILCGTEVNLNTRNNEIYKLWIISVAPVGCGCNISGWFKKKSQLKLDSYEDKA